MEVLSEIIECSVCLERMDTKSKVLPCQHTFCSDCLHRIYIQNKNELKCPECRYVCTIPVRDLPANILLIRLLEGLKTSGNPIAGKREVLKEVGKPCAEALYSYDPLEAGDLKFRRGDLIYLKKRLDENWYVGELSGRSGYLPATYIKVICPISPGPAKPVVNKADSPTVPSPPCRVMVRALYDFEMKEEEKEDCLKFKKDDMLEVIRRVDQNWAEGKINGLVGIFPLNYVRLTSAAVSLLDAPTIRTPATSSPHAGTDGVRSRNVSGPAVFNSASPNNEPQRRVSGEGVASAPADMKSSSPTAPQQAPDSSAPRNAVPSRCPQQSASSDSEISNTRTKSDGGQLKVDGETIPSKISIHDIYRALYDYKPQKDDELSLTRGHLYHVTDRCKDGWYRGKSLRLATSGVFPGNYVQLIPPDSENGNGDAVRTMSRGRLAPPSEKQADGGTQVLASSDKRSENGQKFWGMDVMGSPAPAPKMRSSVRRNASARERRRSSSLSRLENQSQSAIKSRDPTRKSIRGPSTKFSDASRPGKTTRMRYVCVMAYSAQGDVELDLKVGDVVVVLKKKSEGWYKGTNETTGKTGVFPACFVESFTSNLNNESRSS